MTEDDPEGPDWIQRHRVELAMLSPSRVGRIGAGGALPPGGAEILREQERDRPRDPFAPFRPFTEAAGELVPFVSVAGRRAAAERVGAPAWLADRIAEPIPGVELAERAMGALGEHVIDPLIGIIQKGADPSGMLQRRYEELRADAPAWDVGATTRAAGQVRREFDTALQRVQEDPESDPKARALAASLRGATLAADFAIPIPLAKEAGATLQESARLARAAGERVRQVGRDIYTGEILPTELPAALRAQVPERVTAGRRRFDPAEDVGLTPDELMTKYHEDVNRIATAKAHKHVPPGIPGRPQVIEDLVGAQMVRFVEASRRYKADGKTPFMAFINPHLEGAILDAQRAADTLSRGAREKVKAGTATPEELAAGHVPVSLDAPLTGREGVPSESLTLGSKIAAPEEAPYREGATGPLADAYRVVFAGLDAQEQAIIHARLERQFTLKETGAALPRPIGESGAKRAQDRVLAKIRRVTPKVQELLKDLRTSRQGPSEVGRFGDEGLPGDARRARGPAVGGAEGGAGAALPAGGGRAGRGARLPDARLRADPRGAGRGPELASDRIEEFARRRGLRVSPAQRALIEAILGEGPGAQQARFTVQRIGLRHLVVDRETGVLRGSFAGAPGKARAQQLADRLNTEGAAEPRAAPAVEAPLSLDGPSAHAAQFDATAKRYGFASADDAAAAITRFRQNAATGGDGPRVLRVPRPVQEQLVAHAEFGALPLRDADEIARELTDLDAQITAAQDALRKAQKSRTRTRYSDAQQRTITTRGAGSAGREAARQTVEGLVAHKERLLRERDYGAAVRAAGPTPAALEVSAARAEAVHNAARAPEPAGGTLLPAVAAATPLPHEAPVEFRRRASEARGRAIGQREALEAIRKKVDESLSSLEARLHAEGDGKEPSARKVASALKAIADSREAALPRQKIGRKGAVTKRTAQYDMLHAREVKPLLTVRKNLLAALDRIRELEKSGEIEWASLTVEEQMVKLDREHPTIGIELFREEYGKREFEARQQVVDELNAYLEQREQAALTPGEIPMGNEIRFGRVGDKETGARLAAEREDLLMDVSEYLRQAQEIGVDASQIDPVRRSVGEVIDRVRELRDAIAKIDLPEVPSRSVTQAERVGSLNLDRIANPLARQAVRDHYLAPGNAERIESLRQRMSEVELRRTTEDLAAMLGHDADAIAQYVAQKGLPGRGEIATYVLLMRETMATVATDLHDMAVRGIQDERWDRGLATFDSLIAELTGPVSEAGRTLRFQQIVVGKPTRVEREAAYGRQLASRLFAQKDAEWKEAVRKAELAAQRALEAKQRAEATGSPIHERARQNADEAAAAADQKAAQAKLALDRLEMARLALEERQRKARLDFLVEGLVHARKRGASPEFLRQLASMDPQTQFQEITNLLRNVDPATRGDKLVAFVMNNMYSGIRANESNAIGNAIRLGVRLFGDPIAARTTAPLVARLTGRPRAIVPQETAFAYAALAHATPRALRNVLNVLKQGRGAVDIAEELPAGSKFELGAPDVFPGPAGALAEGALRLLSGIDAAFFHWSYAIEYDTMLVQRAVARGARTADEITASMVDDLINPPDELTTAAGRVAADLTYRKALDRFTQSIVDLAGKRYGLPYLGETPVGRMFLTPIMFTMNAAKYAVTASGGGLLSMPREAFRTSRLLGEGGITPAEAVHLDRMAARAGVVGAAGALMLTDAVLAFLGGDLTGEGPSDPERNRIWRAQGNPRYSRRGPDRQWHSYEQAWPASAAQFFVARVGEAIQEGLLDEASTFDLMARGSLAFGQTLLDQPFLRNTARFVDFIDGAVRGGIGRSAERYAADIVRKFEPWSSFMRDVARTVDPFERDPRKFLEFIEANLPLISQGVQPVLSRWGEEVPRRPEGISYLIPGAGVAPTKDPVDAEVSRIEAIRKNGEPVMQRIGFTGDEVAGVELDDDQRHFYQRTAGQLAHARLAELVQTVSYRGWTEEQRAKEIRRVVDGARRDARRSVAEKLMGIVRDGAAVSVVDVSPELRAKGMRIALSEAKGTYRRTKLVESWDPLLARDDLAAAFDEHKGTDDLSLRQYRQLVPLVAWLEAQPEFADPQGRPIGSRAQWDQYHREYREWVRVRRDQGPVAARLYFLSKPILRVFDQLAHRPGGKNPQVTVARLRAPLLNRVRLPQEEEDEEAALPRAAGQ
jgi:hypothetical protein